MSSKQSRLVDRKPIWPDEVSGIFGDFPTFTLIGILLCFIFELQTHTFISRLKLTLRKTTIPAWQLLFPAQLLIFITFFSCLGKFFFRLDKIKTLYLIELYLFYFFNHVAMILFPVFLSKQLFSDTILVNCIYSNEIADKFS